MPGLSSVILRCQATSSYEVLMELGALEEKNGCGSIAARFSLFLFLCSFSFLFSCASDTAPSQSARSAHYRYLFWKASASESSVLSNQAALFLPASWTYTGTFIVACALRHILAPKMSSYRSLTGPAYSAQASRRGSPEEQFYGRVDGSTNPFLDQQDAVQESPFRSSLDEPDDDHLTVPRLTAPGRSGRLSPALQASTNNRSRRSSQQQTAMPLDGRYLSPHGSRQVSQLSSRRESFNSDTSDRNLFWQGRKDGPYAYEHDVDSSTALNTQTITEKYSLAPDLTLLSDLSFREDDDDLHDPRKDNPKRDTNIWTRRGIINLGGLFLITLGLLIIFIAIPAITFWRARNLSCVGDQCLDVGPRGLLSKPRMNLIDPDTPAAYHSKKDAAGNTLNLVFSDEFNQEGRTFYPGDDQFFQAMDIWYWPTEDLEWYDPDAVTTEGGYLKIQLDAFPSHNLNYRSGMLQSWNRLCFKGGLIEVNVQLPGSGQVSGLWPAVWTMGNLARPVSLPHVMSQY